MTLLSDWGMTPMMGLINARSEARFQRSGLSVLIPGALPQARNETAPSLQQSWGVPGSATADSPPAEFGNLRYKNKTAAARFRAAAELVFRRR